MMQVRWSLTPTSAQKKRGGSSKDLTELDGSSSRVQQISAMGPGVANSSAADALGQQWARGMPSYDAGAIADELTAALSRSSASDTDGHSESGSSPTQAASADEGFDPLSLLGDLEGFNSSTMSFTSGAHAPPVGASHSADSTTTQKSASAEAADRKGGESTGMSRAMTQLDLLAMTEMDLISSNVSLRGQRHECDARVKQLEADGAYEAPVSAREEGSLDLSVPLDLCHSRSSSASHAPPSSSPALSDASRLLLCSQQQQQQYSSQQEYSQQQEYSSPQLGSTSASAAVHGGRLAGRRETRSSTSIHLEPSRSSSSSSSIHLDMFAELDGLGEAELGLISPGLSAPHRRTASGGCATVTASSVEEDEEDDEGFGSSVPLDEEFEEALEECLPHDLVPGAGVGSELRTALEALTADSAVLANLDVELDESHDPSDGSSDGADEDGFVHSMGLSMGGHELFDFEGLRPSAIGHPRGYPRGGSSSGAYTWSPALDHLKMTNRPLASDRWLAKARGEPMAEDACDGLKKRKRSGKPMADGQSKTYGAADESGAKKAKKQPKTPGGGNGLSWQLSWRMTTWGPHGLQQGPGAPPDAMAAAPPPPQPPPPPPSQPPLPPSQPPSQPLQPLQQQPQQHQLKLPSPSPPPQQQPPPQPQLPPSVHMGGMPASQPVTAPYNRLGTPPVLLPAVLPPSGVAMPGPIQLKRPDAPAPSAVSPAQGVKSAQAPSQALTAAGAITGANAKASGKPAVAPRAFSWQTLKIFSAHKRDEPRSRGKGGALLPAAPPKAGAAPPYLQQQMYSPSAGQPRPPGMPGAPPLPPLPPPARA